MTNKIFNSVFQSLGKYYRLKEDERPDNNAMIEYYNAVKFVDDKDARNLYSEIVNSLNFFPKVPEIRGIAEKYRPKLGTFTNSDFCYCCLNVGYVDYYREEDGYPYRYAARCPYCEAGKNYPEFPSVDTKFRPEEIKELIENNREKYGKLDHTRVENAKTTIRTFLKSL